MQQPPDSSSFQSLPFWIATVDRREARLLRVTVTEHGRLHVDPESSLQEEWEEFQHGRPSPRAGRGGHTAASEGHEDDERLRRFVKQVADWIDGELSERGIAVLHAFAAPRLWGDLRSRLSRNAEEVVVGAALDLGRLRPAELAVHPAVVAISESSVAP